MGQTVSLDYLALYEYTLPKPTLKTEAEARLSDHLDNIQHNMELIKILRIWPQSLDSDFNTIQCENFKETEMRDGSWYYGSLRGEQKNGVGVQVFEDPQSDVTHVYGTFKDDKLDGQGMIIYRDDTYYLGGWSKGKCNGFGYYRTKNGDFYLGDWRDGQLTEGYYRNSNYEYFGQLSNGNFHGYGRCLYYDGAIVEGEWKNDQMDGFITHQFQNKDLYHGFCKFSLKHGMGILNLKSEEKIYAGNFWIDKYHGLGQLICSKTEGGRPTRIIQNGFFQYGELQEMYQEYNDNDKKIDWKLVKPNQQNVEQQNGDKTLKVQDKGTFCFQMGQEELSFEEIFNKRRQTSEEIERIIKKFNSNKDKYIKLESKLDLLPELLQLQKWFYAFDSKNLPRHFQNQWNDWVDQEKLHH